MTATSILGVDVWFSFHTAVILTLVLFIFLLVVKGTRPLFSLLISIVFLFMLGAIPAYTVCLGIFIMIGICCYIMSKTEATSSVQLEDVITATSIQEAMREANVRRINDHQLYVGLEDKGISFVVTGERDGTYSVQEFDYRNESVGRPMSAIGWRGIVKPSKEVTDFMEDKIEKRKKYGKFTNLGG